MKNLKPKYLVYCFLIILSLSSSLFVSCTKEKSELPTTSIVRDFVVKEVDREYHELPANEQWVFLLKVIETTFTDALEVQTWLLARIEEKKHDTNGLTDSILKDINVAAFHKDYMQVAEKIGRFTLNSSGGTTFKEAPIYAILNLSQYFNSIKEKDSLKKYVDLLNNHVKTDTTKALRLVYHANKADLETMQGDFFKAAVHYHKAIELTDHSEKLKLGTLYHNLSAMYTDMGYLEKAKTYIDSSLVILSFDKYPNYLYNSLGIIQSKTKSYDAAEKTFQTIIQITKKNNMPGLLAQSYANYANLKRRKGAYSEALHYIQLSDSLCTEMGIDFGIVINQVNRAEVYYDQKKYNQAASTLKLIENKITSFNIIEINKGYYELSYRIYDALGNTNVANAYYRTYIKNKEDFTGDLPRSVISEWELTRERERLNYMDSQHKLVVQQQTQKNYFYAFIIAVLLLSLIVVYLILQKRSMKLHEKMKLEQQKMAFELELKSKELLIKSLKDISIQQSKSSIKEDLDSVLKELPSEYSAKFKGLNTKLTASEPDAFLVDFENRFVGVYEIFYEKLKQIAPDLTPNDMILCAMLRLNYTSKEIAYLTNRTVRTIENNRSIIRKKLQLDTEANLQQFILNL